MKHGKKHRWLLLWLLLLSQAALAQELQHSTGAWLKKLERFRIQPSLNLQFWSTYSMDTKLYDAETQRYERVDNRFNTQLRRMRLTLKGEPYENLQVGITISADLVGRDVLTATEAGSNNGDSPQFRLLNTYLQWRLIPKQEKLNAVIGYILPQIGRESTTAASSSTSMEKAWSQNYLRRHVTGLSPGRALGINVGGIWLGERKVHWGYDLGVFNPVVEGFGGNSTGRYYAPLWVGRLALALGDPEMKKYATVRKINFYSARKGITLAVSAAQQGRTDRFLSSQALSADFLLNWQHFNLDGDWTFMARHGSREVDGAPHSFASRSQTGYLRMSYNIHLANRYLLEPMVMLSQYAGALDADGQADAVAVNSPSGKDNTLDLGVNFYFNPDLKIALHYSLRHGDAGAAGDGAMVNNFFFQSGVGPIRRGNWVGLGLTTVF